LPCCLAYSADFFGSQRSVRIPAAIFIPLVSLALPDDIAPGSGEDRFLRGAIRGREWLVYLGWFTSGRTISSYRKGSFIFGYRSANMAESIML